jgi:hypothetical protein
MCRCLLWLTLVQLDVVRQDCGRLSTENNQLHDKLIREGERYEALQKQAYQRTKKLESEIAELSYWKQQAISRCVTVAPSSPGAHWITVHPAGPSYSSRSRPLAEHLLVTLMYVLVAVLSGLGCMCWLQMSHSRPTHPLCTCACSRRYDRLDHDNQGLRKKVAELIKLGEKRSKAGVERPSCCACASLAHLKLQ